MKYIPNFDKAPETVICKSCKVDTPIYACVRSTGSKTGYQELCKTCYNKNATIKRNLKKTTLDSDALGVPVSSSDLFTCLTCNKEVMYDNLSDLWDGSVAVGKSASCKECAKGGSQLPEVPLSYTLYTFPHGATTVYLLGKMTGLTGLSVRSWRVTATTELLNMGIRVFDPAVGRVTDMSKVISNSDDYDPLTVFKDDLSMVMSSNILFANLCQGSVLGTAMELGYAYGLNVPIVILRDKGMNKDPFVLGMSTFSSESWSECMLAICVISDMLRCGFSLPSNIRETVIKRVGQLSRVRDLELADSLSKLF